MAALITQAQWERIVGASKVAVLCAANPDAEADEASAVADPDVVDEMLLLASDFVQEYAREAGTTLVAASLTAVMRRRVAMVASHYAASRGQRFRDKDGKPPYTVEYSAVKKELEDWSARVRPTSADTPYEVPLAISDDPRGW